MRLPRCERRLLPNDARPLTSFTLFEPSVMIQCRLTSVTVSGPSLAMRTV